MATLHGVARYLKNLLHNESAENCSSWEIFGKHKAPPITIQNYLEHLQFQMDLETDDWTFAMSYIKRFMKLNPEFSLNKDTIHRTILASVVVAYKFRRNCKVNSSFFSSFGGVNTQELETIESTFLKGIRGIMTQDWTINRDSFFTDETSTQDNADSLESDEEDSFANLEPFEVNQFSELSVFFQ